MQFRVVRCLKLLNGTQTVVPNVLCSTSIRPHTHQPCSFQTVCPPQKYYKLTGNCSRICGGGYLTHKVVCRRYASDGSMVELDMQYCKNVTSPPMPPQTQACNIDVKCKPRYSVGAWGACSVTCNGGVQRRQVMCLREWFGSERAVPLSECEDELGPINATRHCHSGMACSKKYTWIPTSWSLVRYRWGMCMPAWIRLIGFHYSMKSRCFASWMLDLPGKGMLPILWKENVKVAATVFLRFI